MRLAYHALLVRNCPARLLRKFPSIVAPPEEGVSVEQDGHRYMYSRKSSSGSSKSGDIQMPLPVTGFRLIGLIGTIFTTGLFSLATITSSPSMAFCTNSEKRALASARLN